MGNTIACHPYKVQIGYTSFETTYHATLGDCARYIHSYVSNDDLGVPVWHISSASIPLYSGMGGDKFDDVVIQRLMLVN